MCIILITFFNLAPVAIEKSRNRIVKHETNYTLPKKISSLHQSLLIADLHSDSLLWNRNLIRRAAYGHVDIPRLIEGNIGLQIFSVVTKTPKGLNLIQNSDQTDNITLLALVQRWPLQTWSSLFERAAYQAEKLHVVEAKLPQNFFIIKTQQELSQYLNLRSKDPSITAGLLSLEGGHALEGKIENLDNLFEMGFRIIGFSHFFDNELGGSAHGVQKHGISEFGKRVLHRTEELGMLVDLSHASAKLMQDIFSLSKRPLLVTHTGVQAICPSQRNLTDKQIKQIAKSGGLIGVGFWPNAICVSDISGIIKTVQYLINLVGVDHVALGSDFDGNVQVPFTAAELSHLTHALIQSGLTETQIRKVMGENVFRVLSKYLPES